MLYSLVTKIEPILKKVYKKLSEPPIPNLKGDRDIENSWIVSNVPQGPGEALDFGSWGSWLGLLAARKGFNVISIDLQPVEFLYRHPNLSFVQRDILKLDFPAEYFDLIINCSTIEHVGLTGRFGVTEPCPDGDLVAMSLLKSILKPGKLMLLTVPVGRDRVYAPFHRIYGENRLPRLLEGWEIVKKEYWIKDKLNRWSCVEELIALNSEPSGHCYGLGLFVLQRPISQS